MAERIETRAHGRRRPLLPTKTLRLPLVAAVAVACGVLVLSRFLPGTALGWEAWFARHARFVVPVLVTLPLAGAGLFLATRYRSKEARRRYLAWDYLQDVRWASRPALAEAFLGSVNSAGRLGAGPHRVNVRPAGAVEIVQRAEWPLSIARIILMTAALGAVLRMMHYLDSLAAMEGTCLPAEGLEMLTWSLHPVALALAAIIPIFVLGTVLKRRAWRRAAEVRAVARALAERAAERGAAAEGASLRARDARYAAGGGPGA